MGRFPSAGPGTGRQKKGLILVAPRRRYTVARARVEVSPRELPSTAFVSSIAENAKDARDAEGLRPNWPEPHKTVT